MKQQSLPGFTFEPRRARLDLRSDELHSANSTNAIYLPARSAEWRGLAFDDIAVELPEAYDFTGKGRRKRLTKGELYLDDNGIGYGRFEETNLIPLSKGRMGTWPYSMDTLALALSADVAPRVHVTGQLRVPIFPEAFNYAGQLLGAEASRVAIEASVPARSRGDADVASPHGASSHEYYCGPAYRTQWRANVRTSSQL